MSRIRFLRSLLVMGGVCALVLAGAATVQAQQYDASQSYDSSQGYDAADQSPGRVARLAYLSGQVQFAPAGENDWGSVEINRPMVIGDRLLTGDDGRAVLELGDASVRIDNDSAFDFLNLDDNNVQIELSQGTLNLAVRQLAQGENFEVDTPTVAFVASTPGVYRIDDNPSGTGSMVTVFRGSGTVYGENGASRQVEEGTSYRFNDSALASVDVTGLPQEDDFDRFCAARDTNYQRYAQQQQQYIPPDMIGGDDLYQYGQWNDTPEYGNVWYPSSVPTGWAPYRYGHWAWIDPWGWTWVDNEPWGFAPFHYGRWVYVGDRWGWMPGPVDVRPVYAPALVAFIGGSGLSLSISIGGGGPVGWFPLGPRDVYTPWFPASRNYFTNVNVTNIRNVYVNKTVINNFYGDYRAGRVPPRGGRDYAYRTMPGAVTAVPRDVFTDARPVHPAVLRLDRTQLARTQIAMRPDANPGTASLGLRRPTTHPIAVRGREPFAQPVVARHQPPPRPVEFAAREKVIASQHGQPLTNAQLQNLQRTQATPRNERVKLVPVVAGAAAGAAALGAMRHGATPLRPTEQPARPGVVQRPAEPSTRRVAPGEPPYTNTVHPIQGPQNPARNAPPRPNELPSVRFAHPGESRTLPRASVIRPAGEPPAAAQGRLPVVKPVERAPQSLDQRARQRQQQANFEAQQRAREQQAQQQRQLQEQTQQRMRAQQADQQRAREQQMQQQRQAQMQEQQRAREQQMQQQRQAQMQEQQRAREQQMQQQREAQMQAQQRAREQQMQQQQQQQRAMQMQEQQRAMQMQRQQQMQQMREREVQRAPQPRSQPAPQRREPPPSKHPPESSGNPYR
ncbi:MAG: Exonuclease SbcC [Rhodanobacteraceae bacterium]|nr:MAG: Exonuclease SbcC [Rhodanobacteraceae bacterium]